MERAGRRSFSCSRARVGLGGENPREEVMSTATSGAREHHIAAGCSLASRPGTSPAYPLPLLRAVIMTIPRP